MFEIKTDFTVSASHSLDLPYESKCKEKHGHNYKIEIKIKTKELNEDGMIVDFSHIKDAVKEKYDHRDLDKILGQPTAEVIAKDIYEETLVRVNDKLDPEIDVKVHETEGNWARYNESK